ncbi:hypothetical protein CTI12_AA409310 [Artemisia annua]|uniref:Uncharacterized protein n=1 Tax=Artemisia annua TaxID=35608 RepID=A0A2U1M8F7_ARTAN|nr:hypothetical protein CTI12_AA409310 [Artemisia annua]
MSAASCHTVNVRQHLLKTDIGAPSGEACSPQSDHVRDHLFFRNPVSPCKTATGIVGETPQIPQNCATKKQSHKVEALSMSAVNLPFLHQERATCDNASQPLPCSTVQEPSLQINEDQRTDSGTHMHQNGRNAKTAATTSKRRLPKHQLTTRSNVCVGESCVLKNQGSHYPVIC